ncbi:ABC transporter permease [Propioniciclava sp.]|uniref:ABC transporter permease n=1 Tax=Propioniciclava sp. TaxID=2038686 RepID=UPI002633B4F3|nr:ABC transporter permease [Propioniciclava sp.]
MRLLGAELTRWRHRKGLWATVLVTLAIAAVVCGTLVTASLPPSAEAKAEAQRQFEEYYAEWETNHDQWYADCMATAGGEGAPTVWDCESQNVAPVAESYGPSVMPWADGMQGAMMGAAVLGGLAALVAGASFLGAEYRHGTISTWLTFAPNRTAVFASKMAVSVLAGMAVVAAVGLLQAGGLALSFGVLRPTEIGDWGEPLRMMGRALGLGAMVALMGASLAVLFKNTVAGAAVPITYMLAGAFFGVLNLVPFGPQLRRWLPESNLYAYLANGYETGHFDEAKREWVPVFISAAQGTTYLLVLTGALVLAAFVVFRRRDVTD